MPSFLLQEAGRALDGWLTCWLTCWKQRLLEDPLWLDYLGYLAVLPLYPVVRLLDCPAALPEHRTLDLHPSQEAVQQDERQENEAQERAVP